MSAGDDKTARLSAVKRAILAVRKAETQLEAAERAKAEPIAIVGIGCRLPGGVADPDAFWRLMCDGVDPVVDVPSTRWQVDDFFDPDPAVPGRTQTRSAALIDGVADFDAAFFGIAPREALSMDPQQRLLLEVTWEALEHAGIPLEPLHNSETGVFVGIGAVEYAHVLRRSSDCADIDAYTGTGTGTSFAAGRISYSLGLRGPCVSIETACSSSLVAVHMACASLRGGECDLALACGVNLILAPEGMVWGSKLRALAPDGRCKTFDAAGDGYGRGEGCGVVVLKRASKASADGDNILALVRGCASNHDGRSSGFTVPNGPAQEAVIRKALANARVTPAQVGYVECHGTGTVLGDPIEIGALGNVLKHGRGADASLMLGSVKSYIGHLEAAAGIAGLIRTVLILQHAQVPAQPRLRRLNPLLSLDEIPAQIPTVQTAWRRGAEPRIAAVSSFGLSGTNAHVVLEEGPAIERARAQPEGIRVLPLSARSAAALEAIATAHQSQLRATKPEDVAAICATAATRRTHHREYRMAVVGRTAEELADALAAAKDSLPSAPSTTGEAEPVVFVFDGHDKAVNSTSRYLLANEPAFRQAATACDAALARHLHRWSVLADLEREDDAASEKGIFAPATLFTAQVALAALWRAWGVQPSAVVGHGLGEIAAAHIAGVFDLEEAARIVARIATGAAHHELLEGVHPRNAQLRCYSATAGTLVQGPEYGADFWSRHAVVASDLSKVAERLARDGWPLYLGIGGGTDSKIRSAITEVTSSRQDAAPEFLPAQTGDPQADPRSVLLRSAAALYQRGWNVVWNQLQPLVERPSMLPAYPWQRARFWPTSRVERASAGTPFHNRSLLTRAAALSEDSAAHVWEVELTLDRFPFLTDHRIGNVAIVPAAVYVETAMAAAGAAFESSRCSLAEVSFSRALVLTESGARVLRVVIGRESDRAASFQFESRDPQALPLPGQTPNDDGAWVKHADGTILLHGTNTGAPGELSLDAIRARCREPIGAEAFYRALGARGVQCGPEFRTILSIARRDSEAIADLHPRSLESTAGGGTCIDPALLDGCFQALGAALPAAEHRGDMVIDDPWVPVRLKSFQIAAPLQPEMHACATVTSGDGVSATSQNGTANVVEGDVFLVDARGRVLVEARGLRFARLRSLPDRVGTTEEPDRWLFHVEWEPAISTARQEDEKPGTTAWWLICADDDGVWRSVAEAIERRGEHCAILFAGDEHRERFRAAILAGAESGRILRGIIHLWSLNTCTTDDTALETMRANTDLCCNSVLGLVQAVAEVGHGAAPRVWLVARGAEALDDRSVVAVAQSPLVGLARVISREHPDLRCTLVDLDPSGAATADADALVQEILRDGSEREIAIRGDGADRFVPKLARFDRRALVASMIGETAPAERPFALDAPRPRALDRVTLRATQRRPPGPDEVEIRVRAAGLNFLDLLTALDARPDGGPMSPTLFGSECAGTIVAVGERVEHLRVGDEVLAVAPRSIASFATTAARLAVVKPSRLTFAQAATLPVAFITAVYALRDVARLKKGECVLIHSAAGGVGLAAVQIATRIGAEIFATAGTVERRAYLESIGIAHVMNSRDLTFATDVLERTGGKGVDVVLNSLAGRAIGESLSALAPYGRFVEIGKRDIYQNSQLGLRPFSRNLTYSALDLTPMFHDRPDVIEGLLHEVAEAIDAEVLQPLPLTEFSIGEVAHAFRHMADMQYIGKIALSFSDRDRAAAHVEPATDALPTVRPNATYLIVGGLGGLGIAVAGWLIEQGARSLALVGRTAPSGDAQLAIQAMRRAGAEVIVRQADVSSEAQMTGLIHEIDRREAPLRGVVHAALVLDDGIVVNQDRERFRNAAAPKIDGSWNLHRLTRDRALDFFVMFSAGASLLGSPGQANYAAGCAFQDGLAHYRRRLGLPALSINWGPWSGVGRAARQAHRAHPAFQWFDSINPQQGLTVFERLLALDAPQVAVLPFNRQRLRESGRAIADSPLLERLAIEENETPESQPSAVSRLRDRILALPIGARRSMLETELKSQIASVLRMDSARIGAQMPLQSLGLDSLMALEWRNGLEASLGVVLSPTLVWTYPTIRDVASHLASLIGAPLESRNTEATNVEEMRPPRDTEEPSDIETVISRVEALSDEESMRMLLHRGSQ